MKVTNNIVSAKMENIRNIFREAQFIASDTSDQNELIKRLNDFDPEFRSVAYEGASMSTALKDLEESGHLNEWKDFLKDALPHATQVHIGLGWALAQIQADPMRHLQHLDPMMRYRIMDGYGYYEGFFRRRKSIVSRQQPDFHDETAQQAYNQGLGRSIWYLSNGNMDEAKRMLNGFSPERLPSLWRGLGIAVAYVGGCDKIVLKEIFDKSEEYKPHLASGAVMAVISRHISGYISNDIQLTVQTWCHQSVQDIIQKFKPPKGASNDVYMDWIKKMEVL